uniref:Peptidase C1A papain C-terminal domain-containing protein n=1 Tax=Chlamydomonas leiostraca TaxID=1034604 RepID=A0A7S0RGQ9_9CHLO|mmetsp:Transcript_22620/g.57547  ORF Transcript_22620/g.57547 Transcript_22620/m.57547 type:complete len:406 (+) Transcript_22620:44-1261(+)|eukprot:CAMPEP_0202867974 /NCGR_PEP_ID=MMETSP1391-20130828/9900_1 /ASSEMBLY_ACC=CAM_ASM_000867 /TAXON_ID=1034604 /ORGANISM="Chlamydomonas leiostraca, Strain SAG 11-49" /LENGTH=405 /DNA_ID=CAMNT_0049548067 /DNA_START=44 /DNA_END=1261 /DNA_ORIENTATION=-
MDKAIFVCLLALAAVLPPALAGCYGKNKHLKKAISDEHRYFNHKPAPVMLEEELPKNFDWSNKDGRNWLVPNWNQHIPKYCGSCYLHATLTMISDRLKIAKGGRAPDVMLGRQTFLNCAPQLGYSDGCDGGDVIDVVRYMKDHGLPDEGCMPYRADDYRAWGLTKKRHEPCPAIAACTNCMPDEKNPDQDRCWAIRDPVMYKLSSYGNVGPVGNFTPANEAAMMAEIYHRGPIVCSITCPDDFTWSYDGSIWNDTSGDMDVDHDIEIVGWGEENGVKYWKIRNSWGQYWGVNGFFRLTRGRNSQQIEAGDCWYAVPTFDVETAVNNGELVGSMYGLKPAKKTPATSEDEGDEQQAGQAMQEVRASASAKVQKGGAKARLGAGELLVQDILAHEQQAARRHRRMAA